MESRCKDVSITELHYTRNLDAEGDTVALNVSVETNYARNKDKEKKDSRLMLQVVIGEEVEKRTPFSFKIVIYGVFDWSNMESEDAEAEIQSEGVEVLMSFARTSLYDAIQKSGMDGFVIPNVHFS